MRGGWCPVLLRGSPAMKCADCRYVDLPTGGDPRCRRNAPRAGDSRWPPRVSLDDWCGEFVSAKRTNRASLETSDIWMDTQTAGLPPKLSRKIRQLCQLEKGHFGYCKISRADYEALLLSNYQPTQVVPEKAPETPDDARPVVCRCALCEIARDWQDPVRTEAGTADDGVRELHPS